MDPQERDPSSREVVRLRESERQLRVTERLLKITASLAEAVTSRQVYDALVDQLADTLGATTVGLWLVDEDARSVHLVRSTGLSEVARAELVRLDLEARQRLPLLDAIREREASWSTPHAAYLPLVAHGVPIGGLAISVDQEHDPGVEEKDLLLVVARYGGQALERLRLLESERRSRAAADAAAHRLRLLAHASRTFASSALTVRDRLDAVAGELAHAFGSLVVLTLRAADGRMCVKAVRHPDPAGEAMLTALGDASPFALGEGVAGKIVATGQSVLIPHLDPREALERAVPAFRPFAERFPTHAIIGAPLRARDRILGAVTVARSHEGETFGPDDLRLLEELAERAAVAIEHGRLFQESVDGRRHAEELYGFARAAAAAERVDVVFEAALDAIEVALGATRAAVLVTDDAGVLRFRTWRGLSDGYRAAVEGHTPWPPGATTFFPVLVPSVVDDPALASFRPLFASEGIGALAFVPMLEGGRLLGKLMVYYPTPHEFTSAEVATAGAIASHLATVTTRFAAVGQLEETIRQNELLAGVLAHDLRNPLSAMMNAAQLVLMQREGEGDGAAQKPLGRILTSGQRMTTMIDQLLDLTHVRSGGGIPIELHETDLADVCAQAIAELELAHPDWVVRRELIGDPVGAWDSGRLLQVVSNLIANAGTHGVPGGTILVRVDGTHADEVRLVVHNAGAIPPAILPLIFDPWRGTRRSGPGRLGLGLGLFIVRAIARSHGGDVAVVSTEAAGTTLTVIVPRAGTAGAGTRRA